MRFLFLIVVLLSLLPAASPALNIENKLENPALEQRAEEVFRGIRCVVCAGESIADSRVDLAKNLRAVVREKIKNGSTNREVLDYAALRYGDSILMKPPLKAYTYVLWFTPLFLLLIGFAVILFAIRKNKFQRPSSSTESKSL